MTMDEKQRADTTALPIDDRPEVHRAGAGSGLSSPISVEQDKEIRDGTYRKAEPRDRRAQDVRVEPEREPEMDRQRTERGNRGPDEEPGFGQGA
jgi:hypothetical protein